MSGPSSATPWVASGAAPISLLGLSPAPSPTSSGSSPSRPSSGSKRRGQPWPQQTIGIVLWRRQNPYLILRQLV